MRFEAGEKRHEKNYLARLLLFLNKVPFLRNTFIFKKCFRKCFKLSGSCTWNKGFYCNDPILNIGDNVSLADTFIIACGFPITIGSNTSFSFRNALIATSHDPDDFSTVIAKPITIGKNVWITTNVTILAGVTIGDNTIISAGSVVTHNIPANVLAAGNPCRVIKHIKFNK